MSLAALLALCGCSRSGGAPPPTSPSPPQEAAGSPAEPASATASPWPTGGASSGRPAEPVASSAPSPPPGPSASPAAAALALPPSSSAKPPGEECRGHGECASLACDHYKADMGRCAPAPCAEGERTDNNELFCNASGAWERSRREGEPCSSDRECFQPTCFMVPTCQLTDIPRTRSVCRDGACALEVGPDACAGPGHRRILRSDQYRALEDGTCLESMAQMELPTVCAPCGDGECDAELESACNCPEDCARGAQSPDLNDQSFGRWPRAGNATCILLSPLAIASYYFPDEPVVLEGAVSRPDGSPSVNASVGVSVICVKPALAPSEGGCAPGQVVCETDARCGMCACLRTDGWGRYRTSLKAPLYAGDYRLEVVVAEGSDRPCRVSDEAELKVG